MRFLIKFILIFCGLIILLALNQNKVIGDNKIRSFAINSKAVGIIRDKKSKKEIGSAFMAGSNKYIFTCAHVVTKGEFVYRGVSLPEDIDLKSVYFLPKYDLAAFSSVKPIEGRSLKFGDIKRIRPGDMVIYIGWDRNLSKMKVNKAIVSSVGSAINNGVIVDFLEFQGKGVAGYSGGPIFDLNGNVIAIMREGWTKQGMKGGKQVLMNRSFSIEILSVLDGEVHSIKAPDKELPTDTDTLKNLIGIK